MSTKSLAIAEQRSRLERRANVLRSRLVRTIDALDARRDQVTEIVHHAQRLAVPVVASVIGVAVITSGAIFAIRVLIVHRREQTLGYRLTMALVPRRREESRPPFWQEALRKVTLTALGIIASELAKRGVKAMSQAGPPQLTSASTVPLLGR